jgi:hypothetical protein
MTMMRKAAPMGALLCALASRAEAADAIQMVQRTTTGAEVRTTQVQLDKTHLRTEITDASGAQQIVLFDGAKQTMYMINMEKKTYMEMTQADLERMAAQMQGAMATMQSQMANMPPAQRAQMEQMMRGRGMAGMNTPVKTEYKRSGTDRVGRWTCDKYDGYESGQKVSELCTVPATALGFNLTDLDVTRQMAEFYSKLAPQNASQFSGVGRMENDGFTGFPVRRVLNILGKQTVIEVTEAGHVNLPASQFELPAGLTKQESPMMMGGRGRGRQ